MRKTAITQRVETFDLERFQFSLKQGYRQCPESAEGVAGYWRSNINWKRFKASGLGGRQRSVFGQKSFDGALDFSAANGLKTQIKAALRQGAVILLHAVPAVCIHKK